jgi:hypothetical protein
MSGHLNPIEHDLLMKIAVQHAQKIYLKCGMVLPYTEHKEKKILLLANTDHFVLVPQFVPHILLSSYCASVRTFMLSCLLFFESHMHAIVAYQQETPIQRMKK